MKVIRSVKEMRAYAQVKRREGKKIGFVPTMGALHSGHLSLINKARKESDVVVISIFVNPIQFGPKEDFRRYPRNFSEDRRIAEKAGVDVLFFPSAQGIYPQGYCTYIRVEGLSNKLCGAFRPTHFQGVATVVAKLFNIVQPDIAYFGQKDFQQVVIIKRMVEDLNIPVKIKSLPIVREKDGLAMSSRNRYLNEQEREKARILFQSLQLARRLVEGGERRAEAVARQMKRVIRERVPEARIDYVSIVDPKSLEEVSKIKKKVLVAVALWIGKARLIDNMLIKV